ncbi:hypothetical protein [Limnohabitans sp.]|jgi:hypothetical protein
MSSDVTPAQSLASTRAQIALALRTPAWQLLLQRWLAEKASR